MDDSERMRIYVVIAGILFLNMIEFEANMNFDDHRSVISKSSLVYLENAAEFLKIAATELSTILTMRTIRVLNRSIE